MTDLDKMARELLCSNCDMDAGWYARREAHARAMGYTGVAEALDDLESRRNAPAIDLEQFRPAVEKAKGACHSQGFGFYCNALLALIDRQANKPSPAVQGKLQYDDYAALQAENERLKADRVDLELVREAVEVAIAHAGPNDGSLEGWQRLLALIDGQANDNGVRVDRGALQMALNVLRRAGKCEVADALAGGVIEQPTKGEGSDG